MLGDKHSYTNTIHVETICDRIKNYQSSQSLGWGEYVPIY